VHKAEIYRDIYLSGKRYTVACKTVLNNRFLAALGMTSL